MAEASSFMKSRVILTAAEIDLFTHLEQKPSNADEIADRLGLDRKALTRLLDCLVVFGFLKKDEGRYLNTEKGAVLSADHPETCSSHGASYDSSLDDLEWTYREGKKGPRSSNQTRSQIRRKEYEGFYWGHAHCGKRSFFRNSRVILI